MNTKTLALVQCLVVFVGSAALEAPSRQVKSGTDGRSATVPLHAIGNRAHIDLDLVRADGSTRRARFIVDTGGGAFLLAESLAKDIGLNPNGPAINEGESHFFPAPRPKARIVEFALDLNEGRVFIVPGTQSVAPGSDAEGLLPGHVLAKYTVVFDYPAGAFTIAMPATLTNKNVKLPAPVNQRSGFPRIELEIGGQPYGFLLDTGATYTMMSKDLMGRWASEHL